MTGILQRLIPAEFVSGSVWLVGSGPGDPGLLTLHAALALEKAEVVLHDALVSPEILELTSPFARLEPVGKRAGKASTAQLRINQRLIDLAGQGLRVVRLKGGDPMMFGRGGEEAIALAAANIPFRIVPGISAGLGGLAYAGIPTTHRMLAQSVSFVTGHGAGGAGPRGVDWPALARGASVLVLYMALGQIATIAAELMKAGRAPDEAVAFISDASTPHQQVRLATLTTAAETAREVPKQAATLIVVGPVVALRSLMAGLQQTAPMHVVSQAREALAVR